MRISTLTILLLFLAFSAFAATHTITNTGLVYNPSSLTIQVGDTINFQLSSSHDAVQVSEATYNANGATPLADGFSVGFGGGQIVLTEPGTYYYVCTPHASFSMKGIIIVEGDVTNTAFVDHFSDIILSPNPSVDHVTLTFPASYELSEVSVIIRNISGQVQYQIPNAIRKEANVLMLDVSVLPAGVYILEMQLAKNAMYKKLIKN